jgi:hypothetical protein
MTTKKEQIELKKKAIEKIDEEIKVEEQKRRDNPEVKSLNDKVRTLYDKQRIKEDKFRVIKNTITKQYLSTERYRWRFGGSFDAKDIKSSVKVGVKNGLGAKFLNQISDDDMVRVVKGLISKDLEKTNAKELELDIRNFSKEITIIEDKIKVFEKPEDELYNKKHELIRDLKRKGSPKQKELSQVVVDKLDELIPKIKEEVTKSMIVDSLRINK